MWREVPRAVEDGYRVHHTPERDATWEIFIPCIRYAKYTFVLAPGQFLLLPFCMPDMNSLSIARHLSVLEIQLLAGTCRCAMQELCVLWKMSIEMQHIAMPPSHITLNSAPAWALLVDQANGSDTDCYSD
jgi:hypothetical protein